MEDYPQGEDYSQDIVSLIKLTHPRTSQWRWSV